MKSEIGVLKSVFERANGEPVINVIGQMGKIFLCALREGVSVRCGNTRGLEVFQIEVTMKGSFGLSQ